MNQNYKEFLASYTKSDLTEIRQYWNFSGISHLNKAELVDVLEQKIKENLRQWLGYQSSKEIDFLKNKSVIKICKELSLSTSYINQVIKTKTGNYTDLKHDNRLKESHWELIKEYLEAKYSAVKEHRKNKSKKILLSPYYSGKSYKGHVKSSGVYGKIAKYGLGKMIYIRKK